MKYWNSLPFTSLNQANEMIANRMKAWDTGDSICLAIEDLSSNLVMGTVNLFSFHKESRRAEIGYILGRPYWKYGFMTEALMAVIDYCFLDLNLNRLEAEIDPDNKASAKLLKKLGFSMEGRLRQRWIVNKNITNSEIYGLIRSDFDNIKYFDY